MKTIYFGVNTLLTREGVRVDPPNTIITNVKNKLFNDRIPNHLAEEIKYQKCPVVFKELKNIYGLKSVYDYKIIFEPPHPKVQNPNVSSPDFDKEFLQQKLLVRSMRGNLFSFNQHWAFLAEDPSLEMSLMPAFMEDNSVANDTIMIPGSFDIGKYFRTLDYAFHVKDHAIGRPIQWSRSDVFCYVKFHTDEPIKLKRFFWTAELEQLNYTMMQQKISKYDTPDSLAVEWYYNIFDKFNMKERMIEIIQKNLCKDEDEDGMVLK